jgi:rhamnosyltransferase subunit B
MHVALLPFGSAGDVFPFIWLGRQLRARGHEVTIITASLFESAARAAGLDVVALGTREEFEAFMADPRLWKLYHGTRMVFEFAGANSEVHLKTLQLLVEGGRRPDLLMAPCTAFGARLAREKWRIPLATVHLQPAVMISAHDFPVLLPGMERLRALPLWLRKILVRTPNPADRFSAPPIRQLCQAHGIPFPKSLWWDWGHSPDGVLCLFPEWFAGPQPDWPNQVFQWTFPLEDLAAEQPLDHHLRQFLAGPDKPIVFTPGSANIQAERFFEVALEAVRRLDRRAVFVTRKLAQLPARLPETVLPVEYAPFSSLLPHAAAFVHHGGIGTLSQSLAAGVPQLIVAMAHDQPDNAFRVQRLGAGLGLTAATFTPDRATAALSRLLSNSSFAATSAEFARKLQDDRDAEALLHWVETRQLVN